MLGFIKSTDIAAYIQTVTFALVLTGTAITVIRVMAEGQASLGYVILVRLIIIGLLYDIYPFIASFVFGLYDTVYSLGAHLALPLIGDLLHNISHISGNIGMAPVVLAGSSLSTAASADAVANFAGGMANLLNASAAGAIGGNALLYEGLLLLIAIFVISAIYYVVVLLATLDIIIAIVLFPVIMATLAFPTTLYGGQIIARWVTTVAAAITTIFLLPIAYGLGMLVSIYVPLNTFAAATVAIQRLGTQTAAAIAKAMSSGQLSAHPALWREITAPLQNAFATLVSGLTGSLMVIVGGLIAAIIMIVIAIVGIYIAIQLVSSIGRIVHGLYAAVAPGAARYSASAGGGANTLLAVTAGAEIASAAGNGGRDVGVSAPTSSRDAAGGLPESSPATRGVDSTPASAERGIASVSTVSGQEVS